MVEFQTKFYIKILTIGMKYTDFQLIWRFESMIFKANFFLANEHYIVRQYINFEGLLSP